MWRNIRILLLLLVLAAVALQQWLDRTQTQSWRQPLWVGIYPLNGDGTASAQHYIDALTPKDFTPIESFFVREAHRYAVALEEPVHLELYPQRSELPPELPAGAGLFAAAWWSLKMRWYAAHVSSVPGRVSSRIRIFVLYHDPATLDRIPDSHGLQKGLVGVVHAFAAREMTGSNDIVIAHELMHTLGATDKYDLRSDEPLYPIGYAAPDQQPLYPQNQAEIMAGRRPLGPHESEMPPSLRAVVVGPATALEIRWTHP
ncbi:MAG TPA: hypothetical protein VEY89_08960 [Candidatus Dormibacteraeota bacterium]|nr:hypothetical protein [Candidatus Dormibacteraeota bacterium]